MKLHEAREKAKEEFAGLLEDAGLCIDSLRELAMDKDSPSPTVLKLPSKSTVTAGNYLLHIAGK